MGRKAGRDFRGRSPKQNERDRGRAELGTLPGVECPSGKRVHRSKAAARRRMLALRASSSYRPSEYPLHVYDCPRCPGWHVGHDTRNHGDR